MFWELPLLVGWPCNHHSVAWYVIGARKEDSTVLWDKEVHPWVRLSQNVALDPKKNLESMDFGESLWRVRKIVRLSQRSEASSYACVMRVHKHWIGGQALDQSDCSKVSLHCLDLDFDQVWQSVASDWCIAPSSSCGSKKPGWWPTCLRQPLGWRARCLLTALYQSCSKSQK